MLPAKEKRMVEFLRDKLNPEDLEAFVKIASDDGRTTKGLILSKEDFSVRVWNIFEQEGIQTIRDILKFSESGFLKMPGLGRKSLNEIKEFLYNHGWSLGGFA